MLTNIKNFPVEEVNFVLKIPPKGLDWMPTKRPHPHFDLKKYSSQNHNECFQQTAPLYEKKIIFAPVGDFFRHYFINFPPYSRAPSSHAG